MNLQYYKKQLDELLKMNKIDGITEELKNKFFETYNILTEDILYYYELTINSENCSGIIFLKEKYPNNFIISELLDSKIKYIDLGMKEYQERYWGLSNVFINFYGTDNKDMKQKVEQMTNKIKRKEFVRNNLEKIEEYEEKYLKLVEKYKQKIIDKQEEI